MPSEENPARYRELSKPRPRGEVDVSLNKFFTEVQEARVRHGIADVHVVTRMILQHEDTETAAFAIGHMGDEMQAEAMCAYAFAAAGAKRLKIVDQHKAQGVRYARAQDD